MNRAEQERFVMNELYIIKRLQAGADTLERENYIAASTLRADAEKRQEFLNNFQEPINERS